MAASNAAPRLPLATGKAARSAGSGRPSPKATSSRPPESRSSEASCLATTAGFRPGRTSTPVPSLRRVVRAAAKVSPTMGSGVAREVSSASHSESNPRLSMAATASAKAPGSVPPSMPRMVPIRIFMRRGCYRGGPGSRPLNSHGTLRRNVTRRSLHFPGRRVRITRVELDTAPTICRFDGCTLGPDGGPAPLVQPLRGGNIREYCSDRHRIAAHRARQRRPAAVLGPAGLGGRGSSGPTDGGGGAPSEVAGALQGLAVDLSRLAAEVDRALAITDADRVARELPDARPRIAEAEARAVATAAERDREQAAAAHFRDMADRHLTAAERATTRADDAESARDAAMEALTEAESARDAAMEALTA